MIAPATGELLAHVPLSGVLDAGDADRAEPRRAAGLARRERRWSGPAGAFALRAAMDARREQLARSITTKWGEMGARRCAFDARGRGRPRDRDGRGRLRDPDGRSRAACSRTPPRGSTSRPPRQPVGVCAAIAPFNFPLMVPFWFLPFAIACGNTFCAQALRAGPHDPADRLRAAARAGAAAARSHQPRQRRPRRRPVPARPPRRRRDPRSSAPAPVARHVYARAAACGKRVQALGGAKNHMVVMPDAVIERTVPAIIGSAFGAAGQRCMAGSVGGDRRRRPRPPVGGARRRRRARCASATGSTRATDVGLVISCAARDRIVAAPRTRCRGGRRAGRRRTPLASRAATARSSA